jgi:RNA polymerase sigma-70 factor, ECF subfamily
MPLSRRQAAIVAPQVVSPRADDGRSCRRRHEAASQSENLKTLHATSDEALIQRIAQGDRSAMHVLYARHHVALYRFVLRLVCNAATAEDVVSETFLAMWRQADRFEGRSGASTWMFGIARFKAYSALRRRPDEELGNETTDAVEDLSDDPARSLQKKDTGAVIRKCLLKLSPEHREIIDLAYYHEKSVAEVAEIVGIARNTVKTRLFSARRRLASLLKAAGIRGA